MVAATTRAAFSRRTTRCRRYFRRAARTREREETAPDTIPLVMLTVFVFSAVYLAVAIGFPNPSVPGPAQCAWRLAAWVACLIAFAIHFAIEHFRFHRRPVADSGI